MFGIESIYKAADVADAVRALEADEKAIVISGGTDVLIQVREGKLDGCSLISINGILDIKKIKIDEDDNIIIGAGVVFSDIIESKELRSRIPILCSAVEQVGSPQIRNIGTIGGNISNGVTSADSAPSLFALNAVIELAGSCGTRLVPITEFYTGAGKTVRKHAEILTAIHIARKDYEGYFGHYIKYGKREAMEISTLGCAVLLKLSEDKKKIDDLRISFGVASPTPIRCYVTERDAIGKPISEETIKSVSEGVISEIKPRDSWRASKSFRLRLAAELCKRALKESSSRAGGI